MAIPTPHTPVQLTIQDLSRGGAGVARDDSGRVVFVPYSAPGDQLEVIIVHEKKHFAQGRIHKIIKPSPDRISPRCAIFGRCGGCEWQHLPYALQWETKSKGVLHALERVKVPLPETIDRFPSDEPWEYRNRIQLRGDAKGIGFFERGSQTLVHARRCEIAHAKINSHWPELESEARKMKPPFKLEVEVSPDGQIHKTWNAPHAALGFRQVHDRQNLLLQNWVSKQIPDGRRLFDLFGGNGNLSLPLAERCTEIHCVDLSVPQSSKCPPHFHFHKSPVLGWLLKNKGLLKAAPTSAILDPPREGLGDDCIEIGAALQIMGTQELILIGCETDPWARDVSRLHSRGWALKHLAILDLFPQTHHVEAIALLTR